MGGSEVVPYNQQRLNAEYGYERAAASSCALDQTRGQVLAVGLGRVDVGARKGVPVMARL